MMLEAYEGEKNLAPKPKQHEDLLKMLGLPSKRRSQETPQPATTPGKDTSSEPVLPQPGQPEECSNEVNQTSPAPVDGEATRKPIMPPEGQTGERSSEVNQTSSTAVDISVATGEGLKPVPDSRESKITDEANQELPGETSTQEAPPKPLRKPRNEAARPFRRKTQRDRTGGPPLK